MQPVIDLHVHCRNSIDANATSIELVFINNGLESIQVNTRLYNEKLKLRYANMLWTGQR